jgi:hypothetical protein
LARLFLSFLHLLAFYFFFFFYLSKCRKEQEIELNDTRSEKWSQDITNLQLQCTKISSSIYTWCATRYVTKRISFKAKEGHVKIKRLKILSYVDRPKIKKNIFSHRSRLNRYALSFFLFWMSRLRGKQKKTTITELICYGWR